MALVLGQVTVGTAATFITAVPSGPYALTLMTSGTAVAISTNTGIGTISTFLTGALINANSYVQYDGFPGSTGTSLYGTVGSGTTTVSYHLCTSK
jgi:hypothetical protein